MEKSAAQWSDIEPNNWEDNEVAYIVNEWNKEKDNKHESEYAKALAEAEKYEKDIEEHTKAEEEMWKAFGEQVNIEAKKSKAKGPKARKWCFTWNLKGGTVQQANELGDILFERLTDKNDPKQPYPMKAVAFQVEKGEKEGTVHLQGMFVMESKYGPVTRSNAQQTILGDGDGHTHMEPMKSEEGSWDYCTDSKKRAPEGKVWTFGEAKNKQGKRSDLEAAYKDIKSQTKDSKELKDAHYKVHARHFKWFEQTMAEHTKGRENETECVVFFGDAGTGKTHRAFQIAEDMGLDYDEVYVPPANAGNGMLWLEMYEGQKLMIIDEFDTKQWSLNTFKKMMGQKTPLTVQRKGTAVKWRTEKVIICCNDHPNTWWNLKEKRESMDPKVSRQAKMDWLAVARRVKYCLEFRYQKEPEDSEEMENAWRHRVEREVDLLKC